MKRYEYIVSEDGLIFRKSGKGLKEVPKRMHPRGYLTFKMNGKETSYKRFVAEKLLPNPNGCDKVFSKDGNQWNTHPSNLKWVWTRERRCLTPEQALEKTTDKHLIDYYQNGNIKSLQRGINNVLERITKNIDMNLLSDLYIQIHNYSERNLLFELESDIIGTYVGLKKQQHRNKIKTVQFNERIM